MRWGHRLPVEDRDSLVANVDLTATLIDAANVDWSGGAGTEMYNYVDDPLELSNLAGHPDYAAKEAELSGLMTTLCSPVPPGYVP